MKLARPPSLTYSCRRLVGLSPFAVLSFLASAPALWVTRTAQAAEYYVATTGSDSNAGTLTQPFATLQKGATVATAGDTVFVRGGTYSIVTPANGGAGVSFTRSGTSDTARIKYWAYSGEIPIFDFSAMKISTSGYTHGFVVSGSWLHFKGMELRGVPMNSRSNNAIAVDSAHDDIFELMNFHHNSGTGIFISNGTGGHLVLNCDSHDNYDPTSTQGAGQNADGFGLHYQTTGPSSTFRGCRAWWNSDDGYDFISQEVPGIIENCWAVANGYINSGAGIPAAGNGNGFKAGSSKTGIRHIIRNDLAWRNRASGFYANHSSGGNDWLNNTSYNNGTQYNMLASPPTDSSVTIILSGALAHKMRNNIGFPNKNSNMGGVDSMFDTWDLNIVPAAGDFLSVSDAGFMGPRQPDGSLPVLDYLRLGVGSRMIDKGTNVGLPFVGAAPDLGAYEYGAPLSAGGTGGAPGSGGTGMSGTGGAGAGKGSGGTGNGSGGAGTSTGGVIGTATGGAGPLGAGGSRAGSGGVSGSGGAIANQGTGGRALTGTDGGQPGAGLADGLLTGGCACAIDTSPGLGTRSGLLMILGTAGLLAKRRRRSRARSAAIAPD